MTDLPSVQVVFTESEQDADSKFFGARTITRMGTLEPERLADSLAELCRQMDTVFTRLERADGQFELSSFDLTVEFTAGGQLRLLGSVSAEMKGGATLTFRRKTGVGE